MKEVVNVCNVLRKISAKVNEKRSRTGSITLREHF